MSEERVLKGTIDGSQYELYTPTEWNGKIVVYAHGYRPETMAVLTSGVNPASKV
eukprot:TRINITY_DN7402_c0_g1_i1.p1 TRINITY_DN7402_c0_g1~~TRINITY_DN7402_c0_g1_i1.p1  ORF type:complete len:62 (+),score=7.65 TRINITY_DN7402_c0_g1_i1:26-187(+)